MLAFAAKDALLVVDDFVPIGGRGDEVLQSIAERLFRAAGNHQGRSRMNGHGRLQAAEPPRGLILATGEEVPRGQSLRARLLIVEVGPGEVNKAHLRECQISAQEGHLATAMGAFLAWIASRHEELQRRLRSRAIELRSQYHCGGTHARLPAALAELRGGWEIYLEFARDCGAIAKAEATELERRGMSAFEELSRRQAQYQQDRDPAWRFLALLRAALVSGHAHVANRHGRIPVTPSLWGWRSASSGAWKPQGRRVGWIAEDDLFLDSSASYTVAQQIAGSERLPIGEQTLRHRLQVNGILASVDAGRQMLLVRRTLEGSPRQVLHLKAGDLLTLEQRSR